MKKKMGRPVKNEHPREERITLRLSKEELKEVEDCAKKLGLSRTDALILGIRRLNKK